MDNPQLKSDIKNKFQIVWEKEIPEMETKAILFQHIKTKAEVIFLQNDDTNKLFGITFRSPPYNSTGMPHILEHALLAGSRKYPLKEPFVELLKSSLNTFLNAFTYPDKTVYPVSSENEEDFKNLMDVYLDGVFHASLSENIMKQEGWHYELLSKDSEITYKGVVFSEMKGAVANPENRLNHYIFEELFPESIYRFNSGGDQKVIPQLGYDDFISFYKMFYHPSNSRTLLYGNLNINNALVHIDEYFSDFEYKNIDSHIEYQSKFKQPRIIEKQYPVGQEEISNKKGMTTINWMLEDKLDSEKKIAFDILNYFINESEISPLKEKLVKSELGEDLIYSVFENEVLQPAFSVGLKGMFNEDFDKVEKIILDTFTELADKVPQNLIDAGLNRIDFRNRSGNFGGYPKNISYFTKVLESWLYDFDPLMSLEFRNPIDSIKAKIEKGEPYFESLIKEYLLNNNHRVTLRMIADRDMGAREVELEKQKLTARKESMTKEEVENMLKQSKELIQWQKREDSEKDLEKIPTLKISDLNREIRKIPIEVDESAGYEVVKHDLPTKGVVYIDFGFNILGLPQELISYTNIIAKAILKFGTKNLDENKLALLIEKYLGGLGYRTVTPIRFDQPNKFSCKLFFSGKMLEENLVYFFEILKDIITNTDFDNQKKFMQILREEKSQVESSLQSMGARSYALKRSLASFNPAYNISEKLDGIEYYFFLKSLEKKCEYDWDSVLSEINLFNNYLKNKNLFFANVTASKSSWNEVDYYLKNFDNSFSGEPVENKSISLANFGNEALIIPGEMNYVGQSFDISKTGYEIRGSISSINKILVYNYLWNKVRVQGGAYGASPYIDMRTGVLSFVSWRDPNLKQTLEAYNKAADFLLESKFSIKEVSNSIIGAIGASDQYMEPAEKGWVSLGLYLSGITDEYRQKRREEIFSLKEKDFRDLGKAMKEIKQESKVITVIGTREKAAEYNKVAATQNFLKIKNIL